MIYNVDDDGDDDEENVAEDDVEDENVAEEEVEEEDVAEDEVEWMMMLRRIGDQDDNAEDEFEDD
jgi:hypothetical protein